MNCAVNNATKYLNLLIVLLLGFTIAKAEPDTVNNRIATVADANFWPTVNEGDYIFFAGNASGGNAIYARSNVIKITLPLGKKILIWRGEYERIFIEGTYCESTIEQPTIVTNLGGQVKWGYSEKQNTYRTLELMGFKHLFLTGKYDEITQTGDSKFLGHNKGQNLGQPDYHRKYGLWGNPRWSGDRFYNVFSNIVRITGFETCKVSYVAATEGGFAGFNIKTDNPAAPGRVAIDIQDCFAGWTESEGVYISYSTSAVNQDLTKLTLRNNIFAFTGTEAIQSDNLTEGSIIENNVVFVASCFFRRPFQDNFQNGLHQFSFVEGGITVRNNIMLTGSYMHQIRYKNPGPGRAFPSSEKEVVFKNNYYGFGRSNISYVWTGDGTTKYLIDSNVYGPVSTPSTLDAYTSPKTWKGYFKLCNSDTEITLQNNTFPAGRPLYEEACGNAKVTENNNVAQDAPVLSFINTGFDNAIDYRKFTFWSASYSTAEKKDQLIPYKKDDCVFYYDTNGYTRFYKCIVAHSGNYDPNTSPGYWDPIKWDGNLLPPLDVRLVQESYYESRRIGLNYHGIFTGDDGISAPPIEHVFNIFPIPAEKILTIYSEKVSQYTIRIRTIDSKILFVKQMNGLGKKSMDISKLKSGVYIVEMCVNSKPIDQLKLIKK